MLTRLLLTTLALLSLFPALVRAAPPADPPAEARLAQRFATPADLDFSDTPLPAALDKMLEGTDIPALVVLPEKDEDELRVTLCIKQLDLKTSMHLLLQFQGAKGAMISGLYVVGPKGYKPAELAASEPFAKALGQRLLTADELDDAARAQLVRSVHALAAAEGGEALKKRLGERWTLAALLAQPAPRTVVRRAPSAERAARARALVGQLGARAFKQRQAATAGLEALAHDARPALLEAARSSEIEIKRRAQQLLARLDRMRSVDEVLLRVTASDPLAIDRLRGPALPRGVELQTVDAAGRAGAIKLGQAGGVEAVRGAFARGALLRLVIDRQLSEPPATRQQLVSRSESALQALEPLLTALRSRESSIEELLLEEPSRGEAQAKLTAMQQASDVLQRDVTQARRAAQSVVAGREADRKLRKLGAAVAGLEGALAALQREARGRLGLRLTRVEFGVWRVERVEADGPAARGGVKVGDRLTRIGEWPAGGDQQALQASLLRPVSGRALTLTVTRGGEAMRVEVTPR